MNYFSDENRQKNSAEGSVHVRRQHYQGRYPKKFSEKYKELNPDRYQETIIKVESKGSTPAGMHIPIMVNEILDILKIRPGMTGLDATLGYGGHTAEMLKQLCGNGRIFGLDIDPIEIGKTRERLIKAGYGEEIFTAIEENFSHLQSISGKFGPFDFILADLGVSSMQIDNPDRGFSYKTDGPLDLRMNPEEGISAAERLLEVTQDELEGMLVENADEPYADRIAKSVIAMRKKGCRFERTGELTGAVAEALHFLPENEKKEQIKKSSQRTFQALRIDVNNEYESLAAFMDALPSALKQGGRAVILTFHSGEDRIVKKALKNHLRQGALSEISQDAVRPTAEECYRNSRAHSTKLRWAVR